MKKRWVLMSAVLSVLLFNGVLFFWARLIISQCKQNLDVSNGGCEPPLPLSLKKFFLDARHGLSSLFVRSPSSHQATAAANIRRWQADPTANVPAEALTMPPGDPI